VDQQSEQVIPEQVWDQDVAYGGVVGGQLPAVAAPVVVEGVAFTREAPTMAATFGQLNITQNQWVRIGRNGRRKRLIIAVQPNTVTTAYVVIAENAQQAAGGYGLPLLQGASPLTINYAGELFFAAFGANVNVGFIAELDQG
jgi:hypothetical protein